VKLRPGQNIEYIFTDDESAVPNDRVRAFALWEGWFGYDRKKYAALLREAFEPFESFAPRSIPRDDSGAVPAEKHWAHTPLFAAQYLPYPPD